MHLGDVNELSYILFFPILKKNIHSYSCMKILSWRVPFEGKKCTINDWSLSSTRTLARGMREGSLYRLLVEPMALLHSNERLEDPYSFEATHAW